MDATLIKSLVDAGTVVICLAGMAIMWKAYNARIDAHIEDLRAMAFREPLPPRSSPHVPGHPHLTPSLN